MSIGKKERKRARKVIKGFAKTKSGRRKLLRLKRRRLWG